MAGPEILLHYILDLCLDLGLFEALLLGLLDGVDDGFELFLVEGYFVQAGIVVVFGGGLVLLVGEEQDLLHPLLAHPLEIVAGVSLRLPVQLPQLLHNNIKLIYPRQTKRTSKLQQSSADHGVDRSDHCVFAGGTRFGIVVDVPADADEELLVG